MLRLLAAIPALLLINSAWAERLNVAVASNFHAAALEIATAFEAASEHEVTLIPGSSGKHFAQIMNGAPWHLFLSADSSRPEKLEQAGRIIPGTRFIYAVGRLVLWGQSGDNLAVTPAILRRKATRRIALANPKLAPYGLAARQALQKLGLWSDLEDKLVLGENVAQAFQFIHSRNAQWGFVAQSQMKPGDTYWLVPADHHGPIIQQAVRLSDTAGSQEFEQFLHSEAALEIIRNHGYDTIDVQ